MGQRQRFDAPGRLHHLMNRGIARRTVFEDRMDARYFLALLAREVRAGRLRVYAFSILTTHFHLLAASPTGDIASVMRSVINLYVRSFNRRRRRDGSLFRGRFRSRPVRSESYRRTLMRYIDQNAPHARLVHVSALYPYGSALRYAGVRRPRWIDYGWVDEQLGNPPPERRAEAYLATFGRALAPRDLALVEARMRNPAALEDELDDLLDAAPPKVMAWMIRKAALADQTMPGQSYADVTTVLEAAAAARELEPAWSCRPAKRCVSAWAIAEVGLLRDLAAMTFQQIAQALGLPQSSAQRRYRQHRELMAVDGGYARRCAAIVRSCLPRPDNS